MNMERRFRITITEVFEHTGDEAWRGTRYTADYSRDFDLDEVEARLLMSRHGEIERKRLSIPDGQGDWTKASTYGLQLTLQTAINDETARERSALETQDDGPPDWLTPPRGTTIL